MSSSDSGSGYGGGGGGRGGNQIVILYGVTIQDAIKRGNKDEIKRLLDQARATHKDQGDLAQAIKDLENASK